MMLFVESGSLERRIRGRRIVWMCELIFFILKELSSRTNIFHMQNLDFAFLFIHL